MSLEKKRIEVDILRLRASIGEYEFKIAEKENDILRMQDAILIQISKIEQLNQELTKIMEEK